MSAVLARPAAIAGLGMTEMGRVYGRSAADFAAEAVIAAVADAGLEVSDIDGLFTSAGLSGGVGLGLRRELGLGELRVASEIQSFGGTAGAMVSYASMAVGAGMADVVACVFADATLQPGAATGAAYGRANRPIGTLTGFGGLAAAAGHRGANSFYALAARRHMEAFGTTSEQFGAVAVAQRAWATRNPLAQMREPLTLADHQASRWIAEPLRLFDCCLVSNGGIAVVVTSAERAADLRQPPVHVLGFAQSHPSYLDDPESQFGLVSGAVTSGPAALGMAGVTLGDVDVVELYDCYTYTALISLEDYGFCGKGEGGQLAESGALAPGGSLAVNTGGGQLSGYYMWGMTPLSEGVIQARGHGGERQVDRHEVVLVSGNGGVLDHHATLVLGSRRP